MNYAILLDILHAFLRVAAPPFFAWLRKKVTTVVDDPTTSAKQDMVDALDEFAEIKLQQWAKK